MLGRSMESNDIELWRFLQNHTTLYKNDSLVLMSTWYEVNAVVEGKFHRKVECYSLLYLGDIDAG